MEDHIAVEEQQASPQTPTSSYGTDDASHSESVSVHDSLGDEEHPVYSDVQSATVVQGDVEKPAIGQGQPIISDSGPPKVDEPSNGLRSEINLEENAEGVVESGSISAGPPTPPTKVDELPDSALNTVAHESSGSPTPLNLPPIPIEKSFVRSTNGHHDTVPQTPTTPVSAASHKRSLTISKGHTVSVVLISTALETILKSREAKRSTELRDSASHALEMVRAGQGGDRPREVFEPLRLACETRSEKLMIASLDCISKLISYSFFAESSATSVHTPPPTPGGSLSLVDLVAHTITACHTETTPETVSLQIVKALLSLVLSPVVLVHQSSLLKAVRTVYNVFLLSTDPVNQMVAQGGLTQMVHHVFARCQRSSSDDQADITGVFRAAATEESIVSASSRRSSVAPSHSDASSLNHEARAASHREVQAVLNTMNDSTASLPMHHEKPAALNGPNGHDSAPEAPHIS